MIPTNIRETLLNEMLSQGEIYHWVDATRSKPIKVKFLGFVKGRTGWAKVEPVVSSKSSSDLVKEVPINQLRPLKDIGVGYPMDFGFIPEEVYATRPSEYSKDNFAHVLGTYNEKRTAEGLVAHLEKLASVEELDEPKKSQRMKQILNAALGFIDKRIASQGFDKDDLVGV